MKLLQSFVLASPLLFIFWAHPTGLHEWRLEQSEERGDALAQRDSRLQTMASSNKAMKVIVKLRGELVAAQEDAREMRRENLKLRKEVEELSLPPAAPDKFIPAA